jgi:hypothetical protein
MTVSATKLRYQRFGQIGAPQPRRVLARPDVCRPDTSRVGPPIPRGETRARRSCRRALSFHHMQPPLKPFNGARDLGSVQCSNQSGYRFLRVAGAFRLQMFSDYPARSFKANMINS